MPTPPVYHYLKDEKLTGCFRFRSARFTGRPIMQVQIVASRITNERGREKDSNPVTFWRDATLVDALTIQLSAGNNAGE
ncbi:hypothetical protein CWK15_25700 [Salmonella enterica]|uniref:Uncharacterized protein n=1 Tax=Salmonella enterica TaxID=28901 RepID=A0A5V4ZAQ5_SALER|nr:hypothetical protein DOE63_02010 [Salmonella enterica subsp. diarizonae serovar 59:z10:-]EBU3914720.1 hypothetical protein [Salmonella enterica]EHL2774522.1 hypothetical protein [Salmonella enterica subsp. enterica serovar Hvittingfoss]EHL2852803.1 hypothetical protein [Salmonella enterica subsp. enterica serovar Hvittingfoss]EIU1712898.1 hypothetical protein [Salmonella enterica]